MPGLEEIALKIGQSVGKLAVTAWLDRHRKQNERHRELAELITGYGLNPLQRNKIELAVRAIGDEVAGQLHTLVTARFPALPDHERQAALDAVSDSLRAADLSDRALLDADADAERLARQVRDQVRDEPRRAGLSDAATRLYDVALDQSCRYLVETVRQLPAFQPRALAEVLSRLTEVQLRLAEVLERVPKTTLDAPRGTDHDTEFHRRYLQLVREHYDRLAITGLTTHRYDPRTMLRVAYLNLSASVERNPARTRHRQSLDPNSWLVHGEFHQETRAGLGWRTRSAAPPAPCCAARRVQARPPCCTGWRSPRPDTGSPAHSASGTGVCRSWSSYATTPTGPCPKATNCSAPRATR